MDRSLCLTDSYLADLYGAFSAQPHTYELAWHIRGAWTSDLKFSPFSFGASPERGYDTLTGVQQAQPASSPFAIGFDHLGHKSRLLGAGGTATDVIVGDGGFFVDTTSDAPHHMPPVPTVIERRSGASSTVYGNVLAFKGDGDAGVSDVALLGGVEQESALLQVTTPRGRDYCYAAYTKGVHALGDLATDAVQAFARVSNTEVEALVLGGGTTIKVGSATLERSESGLAYVERRSDGSYEIGNPSPSAATLTIRLPDAANYEAPPNSVAGPESAFVVRLDAGSTAILTRKQRVKQ